MSTINHQIPKPMNYPSYYGNTKWFDVSKSIAVCRCSTLIKNSKQEKFSPKDIFFRSIAFLADARKFSAKMSFSEDSSYFGEKRSDVLQTRLYSFFSLKERADYIFAAHESCKFIDEKILSNVNRNTDNIYKFIISNHRNIKEKTLFVYQKNNSHFIKSHMYYLKHFEVDDVLIPVTTCLADLKTDENYNLDSLQVNNTYLSCSDQVLNLCAGVFEECLNWEIENDTNDFKELKTRVGVLRYSFAHCTPFTRGSAAIGEWLEESIYRSFGLDINRISPVSADLWAYSHPICSQFLENYYLPMHSITSRSNEENTFFLPKELQGITTLTSEKNDRLLFESSFFFQLYNSDLEGLEILKNINPKIFEDLVIKNLIEVEKYSNKQELAIIISSLAKKLTVDNRKKIIANIDEYVTSLEVFKAFEDFLSENFDSTIEEFVKKNFKTKNPYLICYFVTNLIQRTDEISLDLKQTNYRKELLLNYIEKVIIKKNIYNLDEFKKIISLQNEIDEKTQANILTNLCLANDVVFIHQCLNLFHPISATVLKNSLINSLKPWDKKNIQILFDQAFGINAILSIEDQKSLLQEEPGLCGYLDAEIFHRILEDNFTLSDKIINEILKTSKTPKLKEVQLVLLTHIFDTKLTITDPRIANNALDLVKDSGNEFLVNYFLDIILSKSNLSIKLHCYNSLNSTTGYELQKERLKASILDENISKRDSYELKDIRVECLKSNDSDLILFAFNYFNKCNKKMLKELFTTIEKNPNKEKIFRLIEEGTLQISLVDIVTALHEAEFYYAEILLDYLKFRNTKLGENDSKVVLNKIINYAPLDPQCVSLLSKTTDISADLISENAKNISRDLLSYLIENFKETLLPIIPKLLESYVSENQFGSVNIISSDLNLLEDKLDDIYFSDFKKIKLLLECESISQSAKIDYLKYFAFTQNWELLKYLLNDASVEEFLDQHQIDLKKVYLAYINPK